MKYAPLIFIVGLACSNVADKVENQGLQIHSSHQQIEKTFQWAGEKARTYVQTGKQGPVDVWERGEGTDTVAYIPSYWAGYPGRSAFYSRDFCHQALGAHLLGLEEENFTMLRAFAASADEGKKWYPLWAINFDGSPFKLDYRHDSSFVREVPATFELVETTYRLYSWTGDNRYITDSVIWNFCTKAVTDFITLHDQHLPNGVAEGTGKGIFAGAASYNEQRDLPLIEAGDGIASQYAAMNAYAKMLDARGEQSNWAYQRAASLKDYFNGSWSKGFANQLTRGYLADGTPAGGWGKENSWFMIMKNIATSGERTDQYIQYVDDRLTSKEDIPDNIEALSYIPETFFNNHENELGWKWMQHIMTRLDQTHAYEEATGQNGDYPEVSYVLVQNIVNDLMGIKPNAASGTIHSLSHLPEAVDALTVVNIPFGNNLISLQHVGTNQSTLSNHGDQPVKWYPAFLGEDKVLSTDNAGLKTKSGHDRGVAYTYTEVSIAPGGSVTVIAE
ncbi:MAG: hypothetical protein JXQ90_13760 [Cyclobacteriaceae bacterium]